MFRQFIKQQKNSLKELQQLNLPSDRRELITFEIYECVVRDIRNQTIRSLSLRKMNVFLSVASRFRN